MPSHSLSQTLGGTRIDDSRSHANCSMKFLKGTLHSCWWRSDANFTYTKYTNADGKLILIYLCIPHSTHAFRFLMSRMFVYHRRIFVRVTFYYDFTASPFYFYSRSQWYPENLSSRILWGLWPLIYDHIVKPGFGANVNKEIFHVPRRLCTTVGTVHV